MASFVQHANALDVDAFAEARDAALRCVHVVAQWNRWVAAQTPLNVDPSPAGRQLAAFDALAQLSAALEAAVESASGVLTTDLLDHLARANRTATGHRRTEFALPPETAHETALFLARAWMDDCSFTAMGKVTTVPPSEDDIRRVVASISHHARNLPRADLSRLNAAIGAEFDRVSALAPARRHSRPALSPRG